LKEHKAIKVGEFGKGAEFDLLVEGNTTAKWMNRYEKYNTTPGTETRAAIYELKKLGATAVGDKDTINENDSDEQVWDFVQEKTNNAMSEIAETLETGLHNTGTDVKAVLVKSIDKVGSIKNLQGQDDQGSMGLANDLGTVRRVQRVSQLLRIA